MDKSVPHILIVDDDPNMVGTVSDILRIKGYEPLSAKTDSEAVACIQQVDVEVALVDLRLGDINGLDVLRQIKTLSPDTECILLTGHASQNSAIQAIQMGAFGYFQKPFDIEQVLLSIRQALEKNLAATALKRNEERYRLLFENAPVGIFSATVDGVIVEVNPAALELLGSPSADATRAINLLTFPPLVATGFSANFKRCAEVGEPVFDEQSYTSKWGRRVFAQYRMTPIRGMFEDLPLIQIIIEDVTERKLSEDALRQSEKRYHDLFEDSPIALREEDFSGVRKYLDDLKASGVGDFQQYFLEHPEAVLECASQVKITDVNKAAIRMYQAVDKSEMPMSFLAVLKNSSIGHFREQLADIAAGRTTFAWEGIDHTVDGREIHVDVKWTVAAGYEDTLSKVIVSLQDITERKQTDEALRRNEALLSEAQRIGRIGYWEWSAGSGNQLFCSEEMFSILEIPNDGRKITQQTLAEITFPEDRIKLMELDKAFFASRSDLDYEFRVKLKNNRTCWLHFTAKITYDADGRPSRMMGVMQDVTERRLADEALHKSDEQYRLLANNISDVIWILDLDTGRYVYLSPSVENLRGYSVEEVLEQDMSQSLTPDSLIQVQSKILNRLTEARSGVQKYYVDEVEQPCLDGSTVWTEVVTHYVFNAENGHWEVYGVSRNISERKKAEAEIRKSNERFELLGRAANDAVWEWDLETGALWANQAHQELFGLTVTDPVPDDMEWKRRLHPDDREQVYQSLQRTRASSDQFWIAEYRLKTDNKGWISIYARTYIERDADGKAIRMVGSMVDITERKQAEAAAMRITRLYTTFSEINQIIVRVRDQQTLFNEVCRVAVEHGRFRMAWIGLVGEDENKVKPSAFAGEENGYLSEKDSVAIPGVTGPTATSIREGHYVICQDIATDPFMEPWREMALSRGYRSLASIPFFLKDRVLGALSVYSSEVNGFDAQDEKLMDDIGRNISFALNAMQVEDQRIQAAEELQASELRYRGLFNSMIDGFALHQIICDENGKPVNYRFLEINPAFERLTGLRADALIGRTVLEVMPNTEPYWIEIYGNVALTGRSTFYENYSRELNRFFEVSVYCPEVGQFAVVVVDITERKKAEEDTRQHMLELELLYESGLAFNQLLNPKDIAHKIIELLEQKMDWHHTAIRLLDDDTQTLRLLAYNQAHLLDDRESARFEEQLREGVTQLGQGMSGWVALNGQTVRSSDLASDERYKATISGMCSGLYVPIKLGDHVIGVISIESEKQGAFSEMDERLASTLANQASSALENARLFDETQRRIKELVSLHSAGRRLLAARLSTDQIYAAVHKAVEETMPCEAFVIVLADPEADDYEAVYFFDKGERFPTRRLARRTGLSGRVIEKGETLLLNDVDQAEVKATHFGSTDQVRSVLAVPLRRGSDIIGMLSTQSYQPRSFNESHRVLLETMASQLSSALDNTNLYQQTEARIRELETLHVISTSLRTIQSIDDALANLLDNTLETLDTSAGAILLYDPSIQGLRPAVARGWFEKLMDMPVKAGQGVAGTVFATGEFHYSPEFISDPLITETAKNVIQPGWGGVCLPIRTSTEIIGVLFIGVERPQRIIMQQIKLLESLVDMAGAALHRMRLFNETARRAEEFASLYELSREISIETNLESLLVKIVERARALLKSSTSGIYLYDAQREELVLRADTEPSIPLGIRLKLGEGVGGKVAASRKPMRIDDYSVWEGRSQSYEGIPIHAVLETPMLFAGELVGVLTSDETSHSVRKYSESDERLLSLFASQAAGAIKSAQHREELERRVEERTAEIEATRKRLDLTARAGGIGVWELNLQSGRMFWDSRMHTIFGTDPATGDDQLQSLWWQLVFPDDRERIRAKFDEALKSTAVFSNDYRIVRPDGMLRYVTASAIVISDDHDTPERVIGVNVDVTDQKQAEESLHRANLEMERAMRTKDEFLANMSHELRTPLNAILGISESLEEQFVGPLNEKQLRYTGIIRESGRHLLELINDILDISKIEAGRMDLELQNLSINKLCESCLRMIKELAQKKSIKVSFEIVDNIEIVLGDERRLKQSLVNLLGNAVKFTPAEGNIGLEVIGHPDRNEINFTVWDKGVGIAPEDIKLLFQPFVQLDSGLAREYQGTGLGLALVSQMIRLHGGRVSVESELGSGSRFTITLPWGPDQQKAKLKTSRELPRPLVTQPVVKHEGRILLVEDTEVIISLMSEYLQYKGYHMLVARNGMDGIMIAKQEHPDLILMDVMMPVMDGLEATRHMREIEELKQTPIIALTALAMAGDRDRCLAAGMNDYMSKPIRIQELSDMIEKYLGNGKAAENTNGIVGVEAAQEGNSRS